MKEFVEKLIGRLEELYDRNNKTKKEAYQDEDWEKFDLFTHRNEGVYIAISIVNQLAEEYGKDTNVTTNADRIRNMSDEELADFLEEFEACDVCKYLDNNRCTFENPCVHEFAGAMIYDWLQSEVKGSDV